MGGAKGLKDARSLGVLHVEFKILKKNKCHKINSSSARKSSWWIYDRANRDKLMKELAENTIEQIRTLLKYLEQTDLLKNKDILRCLDVIAREYGGEVVDKN